MEAKQRSAAAKNLHGSYGSRAAAASRKAREDRQDADAL
jgi:hypothetical protein